jgi:acyl-CoA oxidase
VTPTVPTRAWPPDPELLAFLPLIRSAWSDGVLSPGEVGALSDLLGRQDWMQEHHRVGLAPWLDPRVPPGPQELALLSSMLRDPSLADPAAATRSLTDLGLALARSRGGGGPWARPGAVAALRELESHLDVVGIDAARRALARARPPHRPEPFLPSFDAAGLRRYLEADHRDLRDEVRALLVRPSMRPAATLPTAAYRARVLDALHELAGEGLGRVGFPEEFGGRGDPAGGVAVFETLAFGDLSILVKFGVQFGLFGGSILQLGTRRHHERYLASIGSLELPGCYAMTETGHGSNVRDLETTATYDPADDEWVVDTPREEAAKDWIGNAARDGRLATVFARLVVGGEDHGVHAVLVPLRDQEGRPLPGIRVEDRGEKAGLNGVDNGRIWFDSVRVPRENLLDRFAHVDADGVYRSEIASSGRRFFTMLGTLVTGRISIAAASVSACKTGLALAVGYAGRRRQFGPEGEAEQPILDYLTVQRSLMPRLATTLGLHFAVRALQRRVPGPAEATDAETEVQAAGLKAYASWHCVDTLQACREACGGQGYRAAMRFGALKADTDIFTTFEGANPVLMQLVAKGLLSRFRHDMGDLHFWGLLRYLAERAGTRLSEHNPVLTRRTDPEHLLDPGFHTAAFRYREERLLRSAAQRLKARLDHGDDVFRAMNRVQDHMVEVAQAYTERLILEAFLEGAARAPNPGLSEALSTTCALYALATIEAHRGWYMEAGTLEPVKSRAIRARVNVLCGEVREFSALLVEGFGIPGELLASA